LTILRAYYAADRPDMDLPAWGSFEQWSKIVRQAVVWCGMPDPADTREELMATSDRSASELQGLIEGWLEIDPDRKGISVTQALKLLNECPEQYNILRNVLLEMPGAAAGRMPTAQSIGMKLHHNRERIIDGKTFDRRDSKSGARWFIRDVESETKTEGGLGVVKGLFLPPAKQSVSHRPEGSTRNGQRSGGN